MRLQQSGAHPLQIVAAAVTGARFGRKLVFQRLAEAADRGQWGAQVVRDRVREGAQLMVGDLELGGPFSHSLLQLGVQLDNLQA